jgi:cytochrome c-type protein NapB
MKNLIIIVSASVMFGFSSLSIGAEDNIATLRGGVPLNIEKTTKPIPAVVNKDVKLKRNYPMQPPVIPHTTRDYTLNLNVNKCLSCHSRQRTEESQAPMVSVTHFMDRDGNFLAEISPRRYFCNQCHITQADVKPLVDNTFIDMHSLIREKSKSLQ